MSVTNLINENNTLVPKYNLNIENISFTVQISYEKKVCITYSYDNNYDAALFVTSLDKENELYEIFITCLTNKPILIHSSGLIFSQEQYTYFKNSFQLHFKKELSPDKKNLSFILNSSQRYLGTPSQMSLFFVNEITYLYNASLKKIELLLRNENYAKTLQKYISILQKSNEPSYYLECKQLGSLLFDQSYLYLCQDNEIRSLYITAMNTFNQLYNIYMFHSR